MANIRVDLDHMLHDGADVIFNAPCDCTDVTGLIIYYPQLDGTTTASIFTFRDAHNNDIGNLTELFLSGARVKVNIDMATGSAYIQNADTNAYLERRFHSLGYLVNLLDNSDFSQPVNQRGESSYTGKVYGPDRWVGVTAGMKASIETYIDRNTKTETGVLTVENTDQSDYGVYGQRLDQAKSAYMKGKTFTFAVCHFDGTIDVCSGVCEAEDATGDNTKRMFYATGSGHVQGIGVYKNVSTQCFTVRINIMAGGTARFKWMALYEGEYTAETLPSYHPKGYAAELAECRRYFYKMNGLIKPGVLTNSKKRLDFAIPLPIPMRISNPTVENLSVTKLRTTLGSNSTPTAPTVTSSSATISADGWLDLQVAVEAQSEVTNNTPISAEVALNLSADL